MKGARKRLKGQTKKCLLRGQEGKQRNVSFGTKIGS